jgi:hypothetical protein
VTCARNTVRRDADESYSWETNMEIEVIARPLTIPAALLMELDRNGATPDDYRELAELYRTARGYEFPWGQIIESDSPASEGVPACREWEFILTSRWPVFTRLAETWARCPISA